MKRVAEAQLTKDNAEHGDDVEDENATSSGFHKADPTVLARRPMKGLPRRDAAMGSTSVPSTPVATSTGRFAGFTGFGTTPSSGPSSSSTPKSTTIANGTSNSLFTPSPTKSLFSQSNFTQPPPLTPSATMAVDTEDEDLIQVRGLNQSFIATLQAKLKRDPFTDISTLFPTYTNMRVDITKSRENSRSSFTSASFTSSTPSMPTPPSSFSWPKSSSTPSGDGFKPDLSKATSSTTFPAFKPTSASFSTPTNKTQTAPTFGSTSTTPISVDFSGKSSTTPNGASSRIFVFGGSKDDTPSKDIATPTLTQSSNFTSLFTPSSSREIKAPESKESELDSQPASSTALATAKENSAAQTLAATPSVSQTTTMSLFGSKPLSTGPAFSFKAPSTSSSTTSSTLTFGASPSPFAKGSIGNPVGFSFGSGSKHGELETPTPSASGSLFGSSALPTVMTAAPSLAVPNTDENANSRDATPMSEASGGGGGEDEDEVFPGEEDEETIYGLKCRVSKLVKSEGKSEWKVMGTGRLKLKKHLKNGSRRLLHRDSNSKRVVINCSLFKGFSAKVQGKSVSMTVITDEGPGSYTLRVPTEDDARSLKSHIDNAIESLP